ncbi:MAG: GNAT family N-acetyltransferase [Chloroflexi bacterium]|nr:GNAT family N-acetyltransferase [Chloroflexota bacterium]
MSIRIRPACLDDAEALTRILNALIQAGTYTAMDTPLTVESEREYIATFPANGVFCVAELEGHGVVGCQTLEPFATYTHAFDHVCVVGTHLDLTHRRQGIGTRLSEVAFELARQIGYEKVFSYVRADNQAGLAFYQKLGFRIVGTAQRQVKIGDKYIDEIIIERFL